MKLKIKKHSAVAYWKWNVSSDDICGICRLDFDSSCPSCPFPGDSCPIVDGSCGHIFHTHCISQWLDSEKSNSTCPMDRLPWSPINSFQANPISK
ncbi:hypothetical protein BB560_002161 [Smittium megazygosporum]|uniref:Anaphase-promoting complex subunit 11 n=1 Tax=Smittium megazygosporum TaxID=133381 RepID=A0A2T9ZFI5_9FUNG|nr:hypothetical protein BB560_002161 [Smittium megazygosporum]